MILPPAPAPVLHLDLAGPMRLAGRPAPIVFGAGTSAVRVSSIAETKSRQSFGGGFGPNGTGYRFDGTMSGILLGDPRELRLTRSLTIATWVRTDRAPAQGVQLVFRGDDRDGLDPYHLALHPDGKVFFGVESGKGETANVSSPLPLGRWTHVAASLDASTGRLAIFVDGFLRDEKKTRVRPFANLLPGEAAGVSIGNVQNPAGGRHNQPFRGDLADVRIYDRAVTPQEMGLASPPGGSAPSPTKGCE